MVKGRVFWGAALFLIVSAQAVFFNPLKSVTFLVTNQLALVEGLPFGFVNPFRPCLVQSARNSAVASSDLME